MAGFTVTVTVTQTLALTESRAVSPTRKWTQATSHTRLKGVAAARTWTQAQTGTLQRSEGWLLSFTQPQALTLPPKAVTHFETVTQPQVSPFYLPGPLVLAADSPRATIAVAVDSGVLTLNAEAPNSLGDSLILGQSSADIDGVVIDVGLSYSRRIKMVDAA